MEPFNFNSPNRRGADCADVTMEPKLVLDRGNVGVRLVFDRARDHHRP